MGNNGKNKIGEIILEYHYMDRGLLKLEKKDDVVCWGEWQDKPYNDYPCFYCIPLEEIPRYLKKVKDTNGESLINSIQNQQTDENSCENCDESPDWAQYCDHWSDSHNR